MAKTTQNQVTLPAVVDLDALDNVRDTLLPAIEHGAVKVLCGAVERISTNALLMLISAAESARRNNFDFVIAAVSPPMQAAIDRLGFSARFAETMKG
jgi:anti-anti-sigma regulatory factor